ncbi:unnamed protein product [Moneuplotes crassus]|uniref:Dynein light chain n=1 Tax=Euplotes crassus TaxID=5936 RepID=A0AAD1Y5W9_EUPCR|nr:unnamed protein product [Moneuplotes crassus]
MALGKPVIKQVEMSEDMKDFAIKQAIEALEKATTERDVASLLKKNFEEKYESVWHCIVGRNFGAFVTHEIERYIYFYIGQKGFLIFSTPS